MKERKEEINLGLREYLCFANIIEISLFILFIFVYHVCDFFLSKYINSLSQTLKLSDQACSTPSLKLGCMKTVFKNLEDQIFCQNNEWHFPKYSVEHQYVQIPVGPLPCPTPLQETGFSTAPLWRCLASLSNNKDRRHKKKKL